MTYLFPDIESWTMTGENMAGGAAQGKKKYSFDKQNLQK